MIDNVEEKNETILQLEKIKYEFFRGRSHDLKTPLASLKIILENMKYHVENIKIVIIILMNVFKLSMD